EVDVEDRCPALRGHVGQELVAHDPCVVHDDVEVAVVGPDVLGDAAPGVLGGDVELQGGPADRVGHRGEVLPRGGHVDGDDAGAVPGQGPGDRLADAAGGAGDDRDLAGQRLLPVLGQGPGGGVDPHELAVDEGR